MAIYEDHVRLAKQVAHAAFQPAYPAVRPLWLGTASLARNTRLFNDRPPR